MSNPEISVVFAYATESEARSVWSHMLDNDNFTVCQVTIVRDMRRAEVPVAWIILRKGAWK